MSWGVAAAVLTGLATWLLVPRPAERRLREATRPGSPARIEPAWRAPGGRRRILAGTALAAAVATWTGPLGLPGVAVAMVAGGLAFALLGRLPPAAGARRGAAVAGSLPQACDLLRVAVEAGLPLRAAVEAVAPSVEGPVGDALAAVAAKVRLGMPEEAAWRELAADPPMEAVGRELARTATTGIGVARTLRELAAEGRRVQAAAARVHARRAGVRSVLPLMLCDLPAFVLLGIVPVIGGIIANVLA